jgi:hypothetical protein
LQAPSSSGQRRLQVEGVIVDVLDELDQTLHQAGIDLCLAEMKGR